MECKHEAVKSVNCALFCLKCGLKLPDNWLTKHTTEAEKPLKTAAKATTRKKGGKGE